MSCLYEETILFKNCCSKYLNFPFKLYFILISIGFFLGLLGSYYPTYTANTLSLVKLMKGFNE